MRAAYAVALLAASPALADPVLDTLVASYPNHLTAHDGTHLIWNDGTRMPVSDGHAGKTFDQLLEGRTFETSLQFPIPSARFEPRPSTRIPGAYAMLRSSTRCTAIAGRAK
jgi:hypothetical protein